MKKLKLLFEDNHLVNNDVYWKAVLKALFLSYIFYNAFALSDYVTKNYIFAIIAIIIIIIGVWATNRLKFNLLQFKTLNRKDILITILGFILLYSFDEIFEYLKPGLSPNDTLIVHEFSGTPFILLIISIAIIPAIVEEIILRGFLLRVVFRGHLFIGLIISSIIFALLHEGNTFIDYIPYFYFGLIVGISYLITKRLEVAIVIHFLNNFITLFEYFN
ncbi:CPBP family intramembrane metalloprotease [Staphylococcus sp. IVB6218]|uniref:CPBP family intramembrane glutamic endopeptidase n=1 Tax=Staphylococcus sp. IVB6218 TaxID=2989767 RepID=UPI0021CE0987|nr:CPBP family intramembrane glutamic endopeptidase [Staphylococcus sp. IVB6218]UXR79847.1 CPBP family intramembrane metalloprotease [Staphylococcus sp. IVB6218]